MHKLLFSFAAMVSVIGAVFLITPYLFLGPPTSLRREFVEPIHTYLYEGQSEIATNAVRTYPVFNIPLDGIYGFCDFELKATTNNFSSLQYWFDSLGNEFAWWTNNIAADFNASVYYCNPDTTNDTRRWIRVVTSNSLSSQIGLNTNLNYQNTIVIMPSHSLNGGDTCVWMNELNDNLIWVYRRRTLSGSEKNALSNDIWHPITPAQWRLRQLTP